MTSSDVSRPPFNSLPFMPGSNIRSAWGHYGDEDELGALNLLTDDVASEAAASVVTGQVFALQLPMHLPDPPLFGRRPFEHHVSQSDLTSADDYVDAFYPQSSSQWDALSHASHETAGFYNGRTWDDVLKDGRLGIDGPAARGIATRGVLIDLPGYHAAKGLPWDAARRYEVGAELIGEVADWAGVTLRAGDVLCVRTGWVAYYKSLDADQRIAFSQASLSLGFECPGIAPAEGIAELVWENGVVAVALDNPGTEPFPPPFIGESYEVDRDALAHTHLIVALGVMLGEMWDFDDLAAASAADGRYTFMLTSAPLHIAGGVGSTSNALAIR